MEDRRVLLADDEEATVVLLRRLLKSWGYSPVVVSDGRAALDVLESSDPPPIALLDWMMPGIDGPDVCRAIRAARPREQGPFLFLLSARTQKSEIVEGLQSGADDYLTKPFDFAELKARLERARRTPPPDADAVVGEGTVLDGRWRIDSLLGKGGMGTVWRGAHVSLGTPVAIKLIREDYVAHPETRARFEREARAASAVRSPYVAEVFDYGVAPGGRPYLVMELLEGTTLAQAIAERGPLPAWEVGQLVGQLARGLERVHAAGIVHRDLKPENVFLTNVTSDALIGALPYVTKLVDFGVALDLGRPGVTERGVAIGTVAYMSPEQMCGARVGPTSDVWALGALAFEALTGVSPFDGGGVAATSLRVTVTPLPCASALRPELLPSIDAWFARACARDPAKRFQTARELGDALYIAAGGAAARERESFAGPVRRAAAPTPSSEECVRSDDAIASNDTSRDIAAAANDFGTRDELPPEQDVVRPARREGKPRGGKVSRKERRARSGKGLRTAPSGTATTAPAAHLPSRMAATAPTEHKLHQIEGNAPSAGVPRHLAPSTPSRARALMLVALGAVAGGLVAAVALAH